jgi:small conductance mechanosensitive channel
MAELLSYFDPAVVTEMVVRFVPNLVLALAVVLAFWLIQRLSKVPLKAALRRGHLDEALVHLLAENVYTTAVMGVGLVMAAGTLGINVGAALAGIGVAGIAVGFAAQDSVANMISGFLIFWDKPFKVGDFIEAADEYGSVVEITLRSTRIRTLDNTYVVVPNKTIIDSVIENHSKHGEVRLQIPLDIAYKESIPDARAVILRAISGVEGVMADPAPDVVVKELAGSGVTLLIFAWVADPRISRPTFHRVLETAKLALDEAGIQIPFPHLQLFVDNLEPRVVGQLRQALGPAAAASDDLSVRDA